MRRRSGLPIRSDFASFSALDRSSRPESVPLVGHRRNRPGHNEIGARHGRFFLGLGSGEILNKHISWARIGHLDPSVRKYSKKREIIRLLWQDGEQIFFGTPFTVDHARLYALPDEPPPL